MMSPLILSTSLAFAFNLYKYLKALTPMVPVGNRASFFINMKKQQEECDWGPLLPSKSMASEGHGHQNLKGSDKRTARPRL